MTLAGLGVLIALVALPAGALAAPAWLAPTNLSSAGQDAGNPQVAVDQAGDTIAVWKGYDGVDAIIEASIRPAGGSWGAPMDLSAPGENALEPQLAVDPAGTAIAVWKRYDGSDFILQASTRPAGGDWGTPVDISETGNSAFEPRVAIDPAGDAVAVWARYDGSDYRVQAAAKPADGNWGEPADLSEAGQNAEEPGVAIDPGGEAVAVWRRYDGEHEIVQAASRPAGGAWGAATNLSAPGADATEPEVAVDPAGEALAVWKRYNGSDSIVQVTGRPQGGIWQAPVDLSATGQNAEEPEIAVDPTGESVAIWGRYDGEHNIIQTASRPEGGIWGAPISLSVAGQNAFEPEVAIGPAGEAVAVWERYDGTDTIVQASVRAAGSAWGTPTNLSAAGREAGEAQVAVDPEGDAVATWSRYDGEYDIVQAAPHDVAGPQLHELSIPTTGTVGVPLDFSVSPFDVWSALGVTAWSFGDGALGTGTSVSHTYSAPGIYTVEVTGTDAPGNASTATGIVSIATAASQPTKGKASVEVKGRASAKRVVEVKGGVARLELDCATDTRCAGTAQLSVPAKAKRRAAASSKRKSKPIVIGKAAFNLAAGSHKTIKVALTKKGRKLVRAHLRGGLRAQLGGSGVVGRAVVLEALGSKR